VTAECYVFIPVSHHASISDISRSNYVQHWLHNEHWPCLVALLYIVLSREKGECSLKFVAELETGPPSELDPYLEDAIEQCLCGLNMCSVIFRRQRSKSGL
jgi:hypothetical protein